MLHGTSTDDMLALALDIYTSMLSSNTESILAADARLAERATLCSEDNWARI